VAVLGGLARFSLALAVAAVACEIVVRAVATTDADGQVRVAGVPLEPLRPPLAGIADSLARYRAVDEPFLVYDADLGWAPRPGGRSRDGFARADDRGARAPTAEAGETPADGPEPPLIELFGDSFTFGDEVSYDDTWGARLGRALAEEGLRVEVLNFGVNAYGIDQAYLRWRKVGRALRPAVVILGLQPENVLRDLNVFRPLYFGRTEIPLSKPRFVLSGDGLRLVNAPAVPPDEILAAIAGLASSPLAAHERFFDPDEASPRWWQASRLVGLLVATGASARRGDGGDAYARLARDSEAFELARRLIERFSAEVEADGASFLVVYLPRREELSRLAAGEPTWDAPLLASLSPPPVRPDRRLRLLGDSDFRPAGHYGPRRNEIVARDLAPPVAGLLRARSPRTDSRPR
jgi:hypothetical protein